MGRLNRKATVDRRTLLKMGGLGLVGAGLGGCAARSTPTPTLARRPPLRLAPVRAAWDRIIRTTVGLRPHRPSGFVLRAAKLDDTTVIHNYGHGGSGMSLSWGTGRMAAEMALGHDSRRAAVIGCGAVGLTAARQLQRRGFAVTIYAMSVPPNTTSNMSFAGFTPTAGLVEGELRTPAWDAQFREAAEISYRELQLLAGTRFGVSWIDRYALSDTPPGAAGEDDEEEAREPLLPAHLRSGQLHAGTRGASLSQPLRHPGQPTAHRAVHLPGCAGSRLHRTSAGASRSASSPSRASSWRSSEPLVVNCSGLGARDLFGDDELLPAKGQLTVLVPQEEVDWGIGGDPPDGDTRGLLGIHMQPRRDGIVLGGTSERGVWSREPNQEALRRIVGAHMAVYSAMRV